MATVKYFPRTTQSVHFENMVNWDVYQTGIPNLTYDDPGVFSLNENNPSIILRGGEQQSEPYGWKFGENSRVVMSIFTGNLTGSAIISEAKLSVKLKDVYKSGSWGITPSFRLVKFTPPASIGSGGNYGFSASDVYKSDIDKSIIISETIIDNSSLIDGARVEFNLDLSKLDIEYGDSPSYEGHTNIAIVTNYDLSGGIPWSKHQYQKYEFYTQTAPVVDRPFMEITFTESRSHYFEWFNKEEFAVSDPSEGVVDDPDWDKVTMLIQSDTSNGSTTFVNSKNSNYTFIAGGTSYGTGNAPSHSTDEGRTGWGASAISFEQNSNLEVTGYSADDFNFGQGDFTVEFWIKLNTIDLNSGLDSRQQGILQWIPDETGTTAQRNSGWQFGLDADGQHLTFMWNGSHSSKMIKLSNWANAVDTWYHIAVSRNSGNLELYVDGSRVANKTDFGTTTIEDAWGSGKKFVINKNYTWSGGGNWVYSHDGGNDYYIEDIRITKGKGRYTGSSFTKPSSAFPSGSTGSSTLDVGEKGDALWDNVTGYYRFNGDYEDRSENSGDIEVIGTKEIETTEQWAGTGALKLNNAYTYRNAIKLEGDTINFGSGDFCIEFMFKIDANFTLTNNTDYYLMDFREVYPSPTTLQYLRFVNDGTSIKLLDQTASSEIENSSDDDYTFEVDTWYHIAVSKDSSNIRVFIDGDCNNANFSAGNYGGQEIWINSRVDNIGSTYNTDGQGLNIYIDELRITTGNKRYTHGSNFTTLTQEHYDYEIPTSVGDDHWSETSLLLKFDETSIYDYSAGTLDLFTNQPTDSSKNQKTVSLQGDPYNVFAGVFAGLGSLYLNSTSYLILPDHSEYDFGTNDFTIEFSVKYTISDHVQWIFSFDGELGEDDWRLGISSGGQVVFGQVGSGITTGAYVLFANSNMTLDDDKWHKVSFCREATSGSFCDMTCRVSSEDGSSQYSQTITGEDLIGFNNIATQKYIGYNPAYPDDKFVGYLDEIRITNGTARYSDSVVDPYLAYADPIELFPTIAQYWDYEEPAIGAEIEDTSLEISHFEYILLPFVEERPQFIDGNMQLIAMTQRGELLDGIDTRLNRKDLGDPAITIDDSNDVLFAFNDGKMQFMRYWDESEDDTSINATDDLVTQEAIDDGGGELDTSVVTFGQIITEQIIFFEELLPFADLPLLIPTHKDDNVTPALANIDGWTPEQFSFSNDFNITPDYRWDKTDIGTYTIAVENHIDGLADGDYPISFNFIDGRFIGDPTSVKSLESVHANFVIGSNEWHSLEFNEIIANSFADSILDVDPLSPTYGEATPPIDSSGIKTFDDWERRSFQFINEAPGAYGVIDDFGMKLNEDNYYHPPNYSSDNHYGYHIDKALSHGTINMVDTTDGAKNIYDIEILEEIATIDKDENIINSLKETIVNWFNYVGFAPHVDVTKDIDPNSYIMFTEIIDSGSVEDHIPMFKDDGTTLARTSSDQFRDKSFSETFDDIVITDGIDSYIHYETQKNYLDVDVPKWNYNDLIEGTVLDPRIERNLIDGFQFIGEENFDIESEFAITPTYQVSSVMGNFWHQSYRFNNGQDTVLDMRYSNDYTETFNLSAKSFHVTGGNQEDGDVFLIYRDQDTTTGLLATLTVEPDPNLMLTDEHSAHVELLITGTNSTTNLEGSTVSVSGTAVDFYDAGGEISGWELEENFVATLADDTELACSGIDTSGNEVTVDWWGYRDSGDATPNFDEWWNGGTSSFRNTTNQTGTLGSTGKWSFYGGESGSETTWIDFQDIDDTGWHHWAFVRNGTDLYFFLDGELIAGEIASYNDDIDFTTIGKGLQGKIKNFRVTKKARWTSDFDGLLDTLKGEWIKDGSEYKLQVSPKLGVSVESESTHTNPIGINDYKVSTGTGGRILSGYLQSDVDMSSYWGEDFASTPTVRNVAGKDIDIRWAWSNGAIPVWDENADGSRGEVHPSVFVSENIETDLKEFYSDSDHFYQYIQAFGNTLEDFGFPAGAVVGDDNWSSVELLIQANNTDSHGDDVEGNHAEYSDNNISLGSNTNTVDMSTAVSDPWGGSLPSIYLDTSERIEIPANTTLWNNLEDDFTFEGWVYQTDPSPSTDWATIFEFGQHNSGEFGVWINDSQYLHLNWDNTGYNDTNVTMARNAWHHWAVVKDGSKKTLYLNGAWINETTNGTNDPQRGSDNFYIGEDNHSGSHSFKGYMNDFRITNGVARYSGTSTTSWGNFDKPTELFNTGESSMPANNMATVPYTDRINPYDSSNTIILREEQETAYDIELPDNLTDFVGYVTYPAIPGLDDLTPDSFQFTGGNMVVVDTKIKKYAYEPSIYPNVASDYKEVENTHQLVANGFGVALDSGQYLDTTISNAGEYDYNAIKHTYVNEGSIESPDMVRKVSISGATAVDLGVTPEITSGVQTGISITDGSYFDTNSHRDSQTVKDPYTVIVEEEIHHDTFEHSIPTTKVVGAVESQAISRLDSFSQDQFAFSNQGMNIAIDSSFDTEYPTTGTVTEGNLSNPPSNSMVKTIFEGRVSLDEKLVNQYDVGGKKIIKLQAIFDEMWTMEGQEVVSDIWEQWDSWKTSQWLDSTIMEVANFGGDFFQLVNQGFNPVADTIKLADFTSGTSENTFLNLVSQVVDDVPFSYNSGTNLLTLSLNPAKVMVSENYTMNEYVWVGKLQESEENVNVLDISTYKFWQVKFIDSGANSVSLYIPPGDESIIEPTVGVDPSGNLSILLSSTSMVDLMYYHRRV